MPTHCAQFFLGYLLQFPPYRQRKRHLAPGRFPKARATSSQRLPARPSRRWRIISSQPPQVKPLCGAPISLLFSCDLRRTKQLADWLVGVPGPPIPKNPRKTPICACARARATERILRRLLGGCAGISFRSSGPMAIVKAQPRDLPPIAPSPLDRAEKTGRSW